MEAKNIFDFNLSIQEAIDFPRAFILENKYKLEKSIHKEVLNRLISVGHKAEYSKDAHGGGQAIFIDREKGV